MKPFFKLLVFCLPCLIWIMCGSCDIDPKVKTFSGTITVPDAAYWDHIKMGIFSGGLAGTFPAINHDDNGMTVHESRLIYTQNDDGSLRQLSQVAGSSYNIASSGGLTRTYSFTLPSAYPGYNESYYVTCFYDANDDDLLDVIDSSAAGQQALGEFNRFTTKPSTNLAMPGDIGVFFFCRAYNMDLSPEDEYMYGNEFEKIGLFASTSMDFNYNITANSGW